MAMAFFAALLLLVGLASSAPHYYTRQQAPIFNVPDSAWPQLNASIDGRLHAGRPFQLSCFDTYENSIETAGQERELATCQAIQQGLTTSETLIDDFGSYHWPLFGACMARNERCNVSPVTPVSPSSPPEGICYQGSVPDYYIDAHEVRDIQRGLEFAKEHGIPVTIKNTGHDFKGRSSGPNTLGIWVHNLAPEPVITTDFTPESCDEPVGDVVTHGTGQTFVDLYDFLRDTGYMFIGGSCPTVAPSGGWLAGGGHSALTPNFGLGVDNAMQIKAVLPNGTYVTANRCQNQDIFFALRGGGGGTFGVVTETTSRLYEDRPLTFAFASMMVPGPRDIAHVFVDNAKNWAEDRWGGYVGFNAATNASTMMGVNPFLSVEEAQLSLKPMVDYFESVAAAGGGTYRVSIRSMPNQWAFQNGPELAAFNDAGVGYMVAQASRLVPESNFATDSGRSELVDVLVQRSWGALIAPPFGFELPESDQPGGPGASAVTPAWRSSLWHVVFQDFWNPADVAANDPALVAARFRNISNDMDKLRAITPGSGAYMNEGDTYEPDPVNSFWGQDNYDRLLSIKRDLDPDNLLSCFRCVGWDETDVRHQCYPEV